jgi:hypothetical protein
MADHDEPENEVQARLVTHPWMDPECWDRVDRLESRKSGDPHPFVPPEVFGRGSPSSMRPP